MLENPARGGCAVCAGARALPDGDVDGCGDAVASGAVLPDGGAAVAVIGAAAGDDMPLTLSGVEGRRAPAEPAVDARCGVSAKPAGAVYCDGARKARSGSYRGDGAALVSPIEFRLT